MAYQHQLIRVGQHLAAHTRLRRKGLWFLIAYDAHSCSPLPSVYFANRAKEKQASRPWLACFD
jgi:hypothetical protein